MSLLWLEEDCLRSVRESIKLSLAEISADIIEQSSAWAPVDTGRLKSSCVADISQIDELKLMVGYDSCVDSYAMVQHERLDFAHPRGGKAKYLEDPFNARLSFYENSMARAMERGLR